MHRKFSIVNQKSINIKWHNPYDVAFSLRPNRELARMAAEQMTGTLRRFELGPEGTGLEEMATLSQYLVYAIKLKELIIDFGYPCSRVKGDFDWMCDLCMDRLHTVHFCNGEIAQTSLLDFFASHPNLKTVQLGCTSLKNGTWMEAIREMSKRRTNLDGITFSGQMYYEN